MFLLVLLLCEGTYSSQEVVSVLGNNIHVFSGRGRNDRLEVNNAFLVQSPTENPPGSWPWAVSIGYHDHRLSPSQWIHACDGTITSVNTVVTSQACLADYEFDSGRSVNSLSVRAGDNHLKFDREADVQEILVSRQVNHPGFDSVSWPWQHYMDITVLFLASPFDFSKLTVKPIYLPPPDTPTTKKDDTDVAFSISGWGGTVSGIGRKLEDGVITTLEDQFCKFVYEGEGLQKGLSDDTICAIDVLKLSGTCVAGRGSGIFRLDHSLKPIRFVFAGVLSSTSDHGSCGTPNTPNVFVRIASRSIITFLYNTIYDININLAEPPKPQPSLKLHQKLEPYYETCGVNSMINSILGKSSRNEGKWPWLVPLFADNVLPTRFDFFCGSTILTETKLLTAAHCFDKFSNRQIIKARPGDVFLQNPKDDRWVQERDVSISDITIHPKYKKNRYFDLAIINLATPLKITKMVRPACLLSSIQVAQITKATEVLLSLSVCGWGKDNYHVFGTTRKETIAAVFGKNICDETHQDVKNKRNLVPHLFTEDVLCAGDPAGTSGTCNGDSGGGAVHFNQQKMRFVIRAVVSGSKLGECGSGYAPNIYARLSASEISAWIFNHIDFTAPVGVNIDKGNIVLHPGQETRLACTAIGNPPPQIFWTLTDDQNKSLAFEENQAYQKQGEVWNTESTLHFTLPDLGKDVTVECRGENIVGQLKAITILSTEQDQEKEVVIISGGCCSKNVMEVWSPDGSCNTIITNLPKPRADHIMEVLQDGAILVCGGVSGKDGFEENCIILKDGIWRHHSNLYTTLYRQQSVRLPSAIYLINMYSIQILNEGSTVWENGPQLPPQYPNAQGACAVKTSDTTILVTGGTGNNDAGVTTGKTVMQLDITSNTWTQLPEMPQTRFYHGCIHIADRNIVLLAGGSASISPTSFGPLFTGDILDLNTMQWQMTSPYIHSHGFVGHLVEANNRYFIMSGSRGETYVEEYHPHNQSWTLSTPTIYRTGQSNAAVTVKAKFISACNSGAVIYEEDTDGDWDVDRSFGGLTLQIKYKDPANMWKGGHAHFEVEGLKVLIPAARSRNVTFDIIFDGGVTKMDGIFNLKIEYSLQHTFEEKGIFEFDRKHVGNHWISVISNKKNGGGNGKRIFPEMEFHGKTDRFTMSTATYNSDRFKNVKLNIKRDPGKKLDGILEGNFFGKDVKITLHGTRNSATKKLDGTLAIEIGPKKYDFKITALRKIGAEREYNIRLTGNVDGQTIEIVFAGKRTEWIKFAGSLKFIYGPKNYQFSWVVDRTNGVKVYMKANTGQGDIMIKYQRNANWKLIKFSLNLFGTETVAFQIRRDIKSVWDRKTVIVYKGVLFEKQGYQGKITLQVQEVDAHTKRFSVIEDTRNKKEVLKYVNTITHNGINPSQFELDANSTMTVSPNSILHVFACNPVFSAFNFLCFQQRTMETKFRADKTKPYKMIVHTKVDKDGAEEFRIDMQTQTSPYTLTFNWPRMRAIVAPYRNRPLEITANHNPGTSLAITSNIRGFEQFSVVKMPNGHRKVTLNNKEVVTVGLWKSGRTITQSTTLPDGRALTTTFKWGNDNNWLNNHIELDLDVTERKLDSKFEWNFLAALGTWKLDAVGHNNRWGDYHIHRTGKYANNGGVWFFDVDGTALWKGNNVKTDIFIKLDTHKVGNGKLDAITAKLIKVVDGKKYEINVTDGKMAPGDFVKVGAFIRDMAH